MIVVAASFALLAASLPTWTPPAEEEVARRVARPHGALPARLLDVTEPLLGAPYAISPLGEGPGSSPDPDPLLRWDAFDCTTFVETALALAFAQDLDEARRLLNVIRYRQGHVGYLERRHFPEAEWIPELRQLGFLEDITRLVAGSDVVVEKKELNPRVWQRAHNGKLPKLPIERIPNGTFALDVWPLDRARSGQNQIPAGTLLHVVRVDFRSVPVRVSHQGIVIEKSGKKFIRHAADRMYHSVVDEPLDHFLRRMQQYGRWPVAGIHLTAVREPANWRAMLRTDSSLGSGARALP